MNQNVIILCSDSNGIYIPKIMTSRLKEAGWEGITDEMIEATSEPENEFYWDTWDDILNNAKYLDPKTGQVFLLHQDGDLFAYCPESMTPTEHYNLFGEYPEWYSQEE